MAAKSKQISIRLDEIATSRLNEAIRNGYTQSSYINSLLKGAATVDLNLIRTMMKHVCAIETMLEFEEDPILKKNLREELREICRALR